MRTFAQITVKSHYDTDEDDVLSQFYKPVLQNAIIYKRAVGYFSEDALKACAAELAGFISDSGSIQLVVGTFVSNAELESIDPEEKSSVEKEIIKQRLLSTLEKLAEGDPESARIIGDLVSSGVVELKIAARNHGIYHEKYGVFEDEFGEKIAFIGSVNETDAALASQINHESFSVYSTSDPYVFGKYGAHLEEKFENLWSGKTKQTRIYDLDSEAIALLKSLASKYQTGNGRSGDAVLPRIPIQSPLRPYQEKALQLWRENQFHGILAMATGTGKTLTSISAVHKFKKSIEGGFVFVVVPYQNLALQWANALREYDYEVITAFNDFNSWYGSLRNKILASQLEKQGAPCVVAVIDTFRSERFQELLMLLSTTKEKNHLIIVDECHHFNSPDHLKTLPTLIRYRLGLSATPYDQFSEHYLDEYFGQVVFEYSLGDAIRSNFLVPYRYQIVENSLDEDETEEYEELTKKIIQRIGGEESITPSNLKDVQPFLLARSRIVGACKSKIANLRSILLKQGRQQYCLFYCGDGSNESDSGVRMRQVEGVSELLHELGWTASRITSGETLDERERLLDSLKRRSLDAIVSIRVLDEGIDIPSCRTAYLLASQRSDRQGIQRRGRVLRTSEETGKTEALIVDFLVVGGTTNSKTMKNLAEKEIARALSFGKDAINAAEVTSNLKRIASDLGINLGDNSNA